MLPIYIYIYIWTRILCRTRNTLHCAVHHMCRPSCNGQLCTIIFFVGGKGCCRTYIYIYIWLRILYGVQYITQCNASYMPPSCDGRKLSIENHRLNPQFLYDIMGIYPLQCTMHCTMRCIIHASIM